MERNREMLNLLVSSLVDIFDGNIESIMLYGSVARGTDTEESDVDIAVIVKPYTKEMHEKMLDAVVDLELEFDKVLSVILIDNEKYNDWKEVSPFYKNVSKEGICLWQVA